MERTVDVVVVGGGIGGCAVARALAEADLGVVVLERQTSYRNGEIACCGQRWCGLHEIRDVSPELELTV